MTRGTSGRTLHMPLARYDPATSSWRTWRGILASDSTLYKGTWPRSGTVQDGWCWRLPAWVHRIAASESSSTRLLPTPDAYEGTRGGPGNPATRHHPGVADVIAYLPTPGTEDHTFDAPGRTGGKSLSTAFVNNLLPTPTVMRGRHNGDGDVMLHGAVELLPTPSTMGGGEAHRSGDRSDEKLLPGVVSELFPTPRATDETNGGPAQRESAGDLALPSAALMLPTPDAQMGGAGGRSGDPEERRAAGRTVTINEVAQSLPEWGPYEPAIRRWERVLGREAPWATEPSKRSKKGRLSPRFVEWMMGWAPGWVTDLPLSRNQQLKILGNGVVPQQAEAAVRFLLAPPPVREPPGPRPRKPLRRATARGMLKASRELGDG